MTARRRRTGAVIAAVATALAAVAIGVALLLAPALWPSPARGLNAGLASLTPEAPVVAVDGADLIDRRSGERLQLVGANWPGFEYACIQGWGLNEGGATDEAVAAMVDWGFTAVRVPLNQQCWFDDRPAVAFGSGEQYRNAVRAWVERLTDAGLIVILDLHWSAPAPALADGLRPMPDVDSPRFWAAVATDYRKHQGVLFDLFAVPLSGETYAAVGMADLVAAVRATGANQPLLLSGIDYANDLRGWLDAAPDDDQLIASLHAYPGNRCADEACWAADVAPLAERVPVVMAESGQSDGGDQYGRRAFTSADEHLSRALAWAWWSIPAAESEPNAAFSLVDDALQARAPSGTALRELLAARER